jgi:hypothetical protein
LECWWVSLCWMCKMTKYRDTLKGNSRKSWW